MSSRTGRPKIDNPKDSRITIRLDSKTLEKLEENAAFYQESKADAIRRGIDEVNKAIKK